MLSFKARNVNDALETAITVMKTGSPFTSRGLETLEMLEPVTFTYKRPTERVLFHSIRDINPFFHLMEGMWILAGRQDTAFLDQFVPRMKQFSDNGMVFHAAYGNRLRSHFGFDQIHTAINLLRDKPDTRQVVLQIWSVSDDLGAESKDIPCNNLIYLKIRDNKLRMTVINRSNDMLWGALGTNYVQFSMIQEYMARNIGLKMGEYRQVSDSYHVYTTGPGGELWNKLKDFVPEPDPYCKISPIPLISKPDQFDKELKLFFGIWNRDKSKISISSFSEPFMKWTVVPLYNAHLLYKKGRYKDALATMDFVESSDWKLAATNWLQRRSK